MFKAITASTNVFGEAVGFIKKIALTFVAFILMFVFSGILVVALQAHDTSGIAACITVVGLMTATLWAVWTPSKQE